MICWYYFGLCIFFLNCLLQLCTAAVDKVSVKLGTKEIVLNEKQPYSDLLFVEGDSLQFICESKFIWPKFTFIQHKGKHNNITSIESNPSTFHKWYIVNFILTKLDNETTIICYTKDTYYGEENYWGVHLLYKNTALNVTLYDYNMVQSKPDDFFYKKGDIVDCIGTEKDTYQNWHEIKDNHYERNPQSFLKNHSLQLKISASDGGKTFICSMYRQEIKNVGNILKRHLSKSITIKNLKVDPPEEAIAEPRADFRIYLIVAASLVAIGAMLYGVIELRRRWKKKTQRQSPHEALSSTVQYADIQALSDNSRRQVVDDQTPYAKIIGFMERVQD